MAKNYKMTGTIHWAKVLGEPVLDYDEKESEWTFDLTPDARGLELLGRIGLREKLKNKDDDRDDFVTMKRRAINKQTEEPNDPIPVFEADGKTPFAGDQIGNGSTVKVKFGVFESKYKGKTFLKAVPYEITVIDLKVYVPKPKSDKKAKAAGNKPNSKTEDWAQGSGDDSE